jgi:23S rRNA (adenine2503-C2)-methyltransferase
MNSPINLYGLDRQKLEALFVEQGLQAFRGRQLMKWVYHQHNTDFASMTDLPLTMREWLAEHATFDLPVVRTLAESKDGTLKWALDVGNDNLVEMVVIPDKGRNTLCVSSQVGCMLDCSFCSTGKQGFSANLAAADIVGQVVIANKELANRGQAVTNVVLMGMGEPLLNFDPVVTATNVMMDDLAFGISKRRVTISTAGVVPAIYELAKVTDCALAISLHAPDDELRNELVPINRKYPIRELLDACADYVDHLGTHRKLVIEYTLMRGVNDSLEHAQALARLLSRLRCKINLIPFNPFPASGYERPSVTRIRDFQTYLMQQGYATMLRTTRGDDIDAACGQLVGRVQDRTKRQARYHARRDASIIAASAS